MLLGVAGLVELGEGRCGFPQKDMQFPQKDVRFPSEGHVVLLGVAGLLEVGDAREVDHGRRPAHADEGVGPRGRRQGGPDLAAAAAGRGWV